MRLAKYLAHAGVASRRAAEALVAQGRVALDGEVVVDPARAVGPDSLVTFDGDEVVAGAARVVYAVHKPPGVISSARDTHGRPVVVDLVPDRRRLYPVGRLDADATGLVILTDDGELANLLTHPRFEVPRTYRVTVAGGPVGSAALEALRRGVVLDDGPTAPARVRRLGSDRLDLTIHEGRNRQVKRMCAAVGHPVRRLERRSFGSLALDGLGVGEHRLLGEDEVASLRASARGGE